MRESYTVVSERELIIPSLILIKQNNNVMTTSELIKGLITLFSPIGHDGELIKGRSDTYFSQKVRNLKSHNNLNKFCDYNHKNGKNGYWTLNDSGTLFLKNNSSLINDISEILNNPTFSYFDKLKYMDEITPFSIKDKKKTNRASSKKGKKPDNKVVTYIEEVNEGEAKIITTKTYVRSRVLREIAIEKFTERGKIKCAICGYDFSENFGKYGKGYIEIHHKKPVCSYETKDVKLVVNEALDNLVPVCPNCHRMLHRKKEFENKKVSYNLIKKIYYKKKKDKISH